MSSFDVESLFQSIDIILTQRLNALSYDTTVIATIVDDSDKDKGHYIVSDDTIKFDAYTTDATYKTGEQVRVTVINGDWSQKKFIEGKYSDKEADEKSVTYIPPLGTTLQSNLSQIGQKSKWTLYTNGETYAKDPFVITIPEDSDLFNLQNKGIYDVLTIAADISTNLGNLSAGNYGLRLDLLITPESGSEYRIQKFITFDSSEMLGNPYNFIIDSHQEKRIAIADLGHVTEIVLTPYQGVIIADDGTEAPAPFLDREGKSIGQSPIYFKNVVLGFGSDLAMLEDNSLKLYTPDLPFYDYNGSFGSSANHKRLGLIWCNKTETNEYIGFSDGIVDIDDDGKIVPYDEIEYLKASNFDERLVAQTNKVGIPSDKTSLTLAANIADAVPLMKSAYENLTTGLSQVLQRFNGQIAGATSIQEELKPLIFQYKDGETQYPPKLVQFKDAAKEKATLLEGLYTNILQYGYNTEKGLTPNNWNESWGKTDYYILFKNIISEALGAVATFLVFAEQETATGKVLSGYRRIYNDYEPKINAQIKLINTYIDQIPIDTDVSTGDLAILKNYQTKIDYAPYVKEDFSEYANRYCIYWYRYNEGYKLEYIPPMSEGEWNNNKTEHSNYQAYLDYCENNNIEYKYRNFLGDNWERLTVAYDLNEADAIVNPRPLINFGLPNMVGETVAAVTYFPPAPAESQILTRWLDPCTVDEKYQAVLFYNHEMVKSNIVVFTNSEEVPPRFKVNAGDVLRIEHDVDSREHYQVYSSANDLLNISDGSKTRQLKCFYDGVLTGDETLADAEIYWYIPVNSTMLTYDKKFLVEKQGFSTDIDVKTPYSKDGYVYFNKKIGYTRTEEIMTDEDGNEMYDGNGVALRETVITINSEDRFFFYKIKSFYESSAQNNTILVYAYVPNKEEPTVGEINFTFGTFGSNGTKYTLAITPATDQIAVLPAADVGDDSGNLQLNLTLYNANSEKLDMTTGVGDSTGYYNLTAEWYASSAKAPTLGEIKNIENSKSKSIEALGVLNTNYDTNKYAGIVKASISYQGAGINEATDRVITLSALYSIPYASSEDLYISGPTSIIYNSQGTVSRLSEEPYCLYQHTKDGDIKIENQSWSLIYYDNDGDLIDNNYRDYQQILAFLPKLAEDNTLIPSPLYCDYGDNLFYIPVAVCKVDNNIIWTQPVIITQNAYESSMLNDWNGSLQINEENGTIMATMVGAGVKNSDNTFSGVLMGDIVAGADFDSRNASGLGLYGFHHGDQSFNFGVDGTAFLGKAGSGRIYFDGYKGTIKSGSYDVNGASGMLIDLDDALIHMRGINSEIRLNALASGYTPYFEITSPGDNNSLIYISDNNYYLQSDNYNINEGMRIDLKSGTIDAYRFKLDSAHVLIDSIYGNPYLEVKSSDDKTLLYVGDSNYYLQSSDFNNDGQQGTHINLKEGRILAYKFELNAWNNDAQSGILIKSDGNPYLQIGSISKNNYILFDESNGLDIKTKQFELNAWNDNQGIYINSNPIDGDMPTGYYLLVGKIAEDKKDHNYIGLHNADGLSIYTNKFELNTPTLQISSGNEQEKPFFEVRTGYAPDGKILTHIASDEIYLQSDNFSFDEENNGLKIDITKGQILFGKSAKMSFISDYRGNYVEITSGKDWSEDKTTIALYVRPRFVSQDVYITHSLYGGTDPTGTDAAAVNAVSNIDTMSRMFSEPSIEEGNVQAGNGDNSSNTENTGAKLPFPDFEETIMKPDDNYIITRWSINQYGKGKGIHLANSCLYGQITIGKWDGTGSENNPTYGSTNPFFRCYVPAYIGQIAIQNNEIWNETGLTKPITFKSPVTFDSDIPTVFNSKVTFNQEASLVLNAGEMQVKGPLKIYKTDSDKCVILSAEEFGDANCIQIQDNLDIVYKLRTKLLEVTGAPSSLIGASLPGVNLGVSYQNGMATKCAMTVLPSKITIDESVTSFSIDAIETIFNKAIKIDGGLAVSNGAFTCESGATFNSNVIIASKGLLQIGDRELGELAFANEVKKNLNVTMTGSLPNSYYTKTGKSSQSYYDYTISQGSRTVSGTANGTYVATGNEVAGEEYPVECSYSDTYSVDELSYDLITIEYDTFTPASGTVTMIGDSGEIAFGPAPEGGAAETESINISADSVTVS